MAYCSSPNCNNFSGKELYCFECREKWRKKRTAEARSRKDGAVGPVMVNRGAKDGTYEYSNMEE